LVLAGLGFWGVIQFSRRLPAMAVESAAVMLLAAAMEVPVAGWVGLRHTSQGAEQAALQGRVTMAAMDTIRVVKIWGVVEVAVHLRRGGTRLPARGMRRAAQEVTD
jgi:hypothetical protein